MNIPNDTLGALRASKLCAELSDAQCATLAALTTMRTLADGEVLVREGAPDSHLHLLVSGAVEVVRGNGTPDAVTLFAMVPGDTIGELSFLDDHVHYASVVSRGASRVLALDRSQLESLLDRDPHIVYRVMRAIVRRVHQIQTRLSAQASELTNYIYKQHGRY
jgi:CRP/FNR family cyclic AMP-dependent transcriptional regulator